MVQQAAQLGPALEPAALLPSVDWEHRQELLRRRRCGWCAEQVAARLVLAGGACPHCDTALYPRQDMDPEAMVAALARRWHRWKWLAWGLIAVGTFIGGFFPIAAGLVLFAGLVGLHLGLVRKPLKWLSAGRRFTTRFMLRLLLALLSFVNLVISALAPLLPGLGALVVAVCSVLSAALYTELALRLITNRLRRETSTERLDAWEWALPAALLGGLLLAAVSMVALSAGALYGLLWMDIPGVSDIAAFLLSTGGA
jgi:hypothetical protein